VGLHYEEFLRRGADKLGFLKATVEIALAESRVRRGISQLPEDSQALAEFHFFRSGCFFFADFLSLFFRVLEAISLLPDLYLCSQILLLPRPASPIFLIRSR